MAYQFDFTSINADNLRVLGEGMVLSLEITVTAIVVGIVWGTLLAMMRLSGIKPLQWFGQGYVNLFRSIPLVMVLLWFFLIVPQVLQKIFNLSPATDMRMTSALVAFALFEAAYYSEIIRAGIQSVSRGQMFAAYAMGMTYGQAMRLVILPQAFRNMLPVLLTQTIILFQDTSLVYAIGAYDLLKGFETAGKNFGRPIEMYLTAAVLYFIICFSLSYVVKRLHKKIAIIR